jgi:hypothetical protein
LASFRNAITCSRETVGNPPENRRSIHPPPGSRSTLAREHASPRTQACRSDFPTQDTDWLKNICVKPLDDGDFEMTYQRVEFTRLTPDELKDKGSGLKSVVIDDE